MRKVVQDREPPGGAPRPFAEVGDPSAAAKPSGASELFRSPAHLPNRSFRSVRKFRRRNQCHGFTTWLRGVEVLEENEVLPAYSAVMDSVPAASFVVV